MFSAGLGKAQIRGLETLVTSVSRFSEIVNYIKNQVGKDKKGKWLQVGSRLLEQLELMETRAAQMGASFKLTGQSLHKIKGEDIPENILEKLEDLENEEYVSDSKFVSALETIVGNDLDLRYKSLILKHAQSGICFKLTNQSLRNLKSESIPEDILSNLEYLKNQVYTSEDMLVSVLEKTVGKVMTSQCKSLILEHTRAETGFEITGRSLTELKERSIPGNILTKLEDLKDQEYAGEDKFVAVLETAIGKELPFQHKSLILKHTLLSPSMLLDIKMKLARGWAKQVVAHYLYSAIQK